METPRETPNDIKWIFSAEVLEQLTPSREKGISAELERKYRREGAKFVIDASNTLKLDTLATGAVFFHRFFMVQSFTEFDRFVVAAACVLLAGKVEETPKKCKHIIQVARKLLSLDQAKGFGAKPLDELISYERVLLQTIRFDLQIDHPYNYLLDFARNMKVCLTAGEKQKIEQVLQMAWTFINDSLCTTLCLQWDPPVIAVALLYLAGKLTKFDLQTAFKAKNRSWWRQYVATVDIHDLDSICHQVLDVYSEEVKPDQPETSLPQYTTPVSDVKEPSSSSTTAAVSTDAIKSFASVPHFPHPAIPQQSNPSTLSFPIGQGNLMTLHPSMLPPGTQPNNPLSLIGPPGTNIPGATHSIMQGMTPPTSVSQLMQQSILGQYPQPLLPPGMVYPSNPPSIPSPHHPPFKTHYMTPPHIPTISKTITGNGSSSSTTVSSTTTTTPHVPANYHTWR